MILAALVETASTNCRSVKPRLPTISEYITATRGSTPELPPVVSSIRLPWVFTASDSTAHRSPRN